MNYTYLVRWQALPHMARSRVALFGWARAAAQPKCHGGAAAPPYRIYQATG